MGLILAIVAAVCTVLWTVLVIGANMMSDAPSQSGVSIWPGLVIGFGITGVLVVTHFHSFAW